MMSTNSYYALLQNKMYLMTPHLYTRILFILGPRVSLHLFICCIFKSVCASIFIIHDRVVILSCQWFLSFVSEMFFFTPFSYFAFLHAFSHDLYTILRLFVKVCYQETVKRNSIQGPRVCSC